MTIVTTPFCGACFYMLFLDGSGENKERSTYYIKTHVIMTVLNRSQLWCGYPDKGLVEKKEYKVTREMGKKV